MPIIETRENTLSNWLKDEYKPNKAFNRDAGVVNEVGAETYLTGQVLGKITASGKYIISKAGAADGSEVPAGIFMWEGPLLNFTAEIEAATDTNVAVLVRGPAIVGAETIIYDNSFDAAEMKTALGELGILVEEQLEGGLN